MEFQVPITTGTPQCVLCWARAPSADLSTTMLHALDIVDTPEIMNTVIGNTQAANISTRVWEKLLYIECDSLYSIRNQANTKVRCKAIKMTAKRDIAAISQVGEMNFNNPINVAGWYLGYSQGSTGNATNANLNADRVNIEELPPMKVMFKFKTKKFILGPGECRYFKTKYKRWFSLWDLYGIIEGGTNLLGEPKYGWWRKQSAYVFKISSESADYKDGQANPLLAESTRTTPSALMTLDIQYYTLKPTSITDGPTTTFLSLGTTGVVGAPTSTLIQNMTDADFSTQLQQNAGNI